MKKSAMLIGTAVLALVFAQAAMADPSLTQLKEVGDVDLVSGTSLFAVQGDGGYYLENMDGEAVTDARYGSSFSYDSGYITAYLASDELNREGLLLTDGTEVIECKYGDIKIPNEHWAVAFTLTPADANNYDYEAWFTGEDDDKYFLIETADIYHLADGAATLAGSLPRENMNDYAAQGDYIAIENRADGSVTLYDSAFNVAAEGLSSTYTTPDGIQTEDYEIYSENGQQGVKDKDGNVLVAPAYKYVYDVTDGFVRVSTGDFEGVLDLQGNVIVPAEADSIIRGYTAPVKEGEDTFTGKYVVGGYVAAEVGGKLAYYDLSGNQTVAPTLAKDLFEFNGASATYTDLEGNVHILAADGVDTVLDDAHKDVRALESGSGYLYQFTDENYNKGLIDWHGNELLPVGSSELELTGDGSVLLAGVDYSSGILYAVDLGIGAAAAPAVEETEVAVDGTDGEAA